MKTSIIILLAYLTMFVIALSCNKAQSVDANLTTVHLGIKGDTYTKADFSDLKGIQWTVGDPVQIVRLNDAGTDLSEVAVPVISGISADKYTATVSAAFAADKSYAFRYKHNGLNEFVFANNLTQPAAGTMPSDYLHLHSGNTVAALSSSDIDAGATDVSMKIAGTILRFMPFTSTYTGESVKSISFEADSYILGTVGYNYHSDGSFKDFGGGRYFWDGNQHKTGMVKLSSSFSLSGVTSKELSSGIYLPIPAQAGTISGYRVIVETDAAIYTFVTDKDLVVKENVVVNFPLNLDKASRVDLASAVWPVGGEFYINGIGVDVGVYPYTITQNSPVETTIALGDIKHYPGAFSYVQSHIRGFEITSRPGNDVMGLNPNMINFDFYADKGNFDIVYRVIADTYASRTYTVHVTRPAVKEFTVPTTSFDVTSAFTSVNIPVTVRGGVEWSVSIISDETGSATYTKNASSVDVNFGANTDPSAKTIVVRLSTTDDDILTKTYYVTITQGAYGEWPVSSTISFKGLSGSASSFKDNSSNDVLSGTSMEDGDVYNLVVKSGSSPVHFYFNLTNVTLRGAVSGNVTTDDSVKVTGYTNDAGMPFWYGEPASGAIIFTATASNGATRMFTVNVSN